MSIPTCLEACVGPVWGVSSSGIVSSLVTGMIIDASTEKIGFKYYPMTTSAVTGCDLRVTRTGTPGNFRIGVFSDSSGSPNDAAQLGGYSSNWTPGSGSGWIGAQTLSTNTGALTKGTPIWIVIEYVSGTIDGSNYIQAEYVNGKLISENRLSNSVRHHNGTNWTTTTAQSVMPTVVVSHADGSYVGFPLTTGLAATSAADIYVNGGTTQVQGVRFKAGAQVKVIGVAYFLTKTGSPNDLVFTVYEGDTSKYSVTEVAANVTSGALSKIYFDSPVLLAADTNLYILLSQTGTSDANDYDLRAWTLHSTYVGAAVSSDFRMVYGNGTTPSGLTVSTDVWVPLLMPLIGDPTTDLDMSGGGGVVMPVIGGGGVVF
jgi:hypothetical protein